LGHAPPREAGGGIQTQRQSGDLIRLLLFSQNKKSRLMNVTTGEELLIPQLAEIYLVLSEAKMRADRQSSPLCVPL
jgi:hypothetical protein